MATSKLTKSQTIGWKRVFDGTYTSTSGKIDIPNVRTYVLFLVIGYIGTNSGGSRFTQLVSPQQSYSLDYSYYNSVSLSKNQINFNDNDSLTVGLPQNGVVTEVYGLRM